jgi:ribonuclease J
VVQLTFYGGVKEIGGNKILLQDHDTRIFLDFGMSFSRRGRYFEEFLNPRTANGIGDFLTMGLLPDITGIYRDDLLTHHGRPPETPTIDAVLLSHAHADHANYISFLHKDIPIHLSTTCHRILTAVAEQSTRDIEHEVLDYRTRPIKKTDRGTPPTKRTFHTFKNHDHLTIGCLDIEPIQVDHSVPGAYAFLIHTTQGTIIYTGDLRTHGLHATLTQDFMTQAKQSKPIAMITEGTRIDRGRTGESEHKVYTDAKQAITTCTDLSLVDFNFKDVDRFTTFYHIATDLNKTLVISFKHACFLEQYHHDTSLGVPHTIDPHIAILKPKRQTGTYCDDDYHDDYIKKRLHYPNIITADTITQHPCDYIVVLNYWYFNSLIDLQPQHGTYIHSLSEPFNEEMEVSFHRMQEWIQFFHLNYKQAHCSGHINGADLRDLIRTIQPQRLFPIHTEHPGMIRLPIKTTRVQEGKTYKL